MDKNPAPPGSSAAQTWQWLPQQMPGVAKLMRERRKALGDAWVNECWKRGVVKGEPGWYFAAEGSLMVGTMWDDAELFAVVKHKITPTQALLVLRTEGAPSGQS